MKHAKAMLAVVLSAAMIGQTVAPVYADTVNATPSQGTFHYIAIGDSIGSGYAIETNTSIQNYYAALPQYNYYRSPETSYPSLVADSLESILLEQGRIGSEEDFTWSNLGMAAYQIDSFIDLINDPDYILPSYDSLYSDFAEDRARYETMDHAVLEPLVASYNREVIKGMLRNYYYSEDPENEAADTILGLEMYYGLCWNSTEEFREWVQDNVSSEEAFNTWFNAWHTDYFQNFYPQLIYSVKAKMHDTFIEEVQKADLITLDAGANNLLGNYLTYLYSLGIGPDAEEVKDPETGSSYYLNARNPIFIALATVFAMGILGGGKVEFGDAALTIPVILSSYKDQLSMEDVVEVLKYMRTSEVISTLDGFVDDAMTKLPKLTDMVLEINHNAGKDADLALIGHYAALGNSFTADGVTYNMITMTQIVLRDAIQILFNNEEETAENISLNADAAGLSEEEILASAKSYDEGLEQLDALLAAEEGEEAISSPASADGTDALEELIPESLLNSKAFLLITRLIRDLQYPVVYAIAGYPGREAIKRFNSQIKEYAEENGFMYVDVYDMPNDERSDPHPTVAGHQYIADQIIPVLREKYAGAEAVAPVEEPVVTFPTLKLFQTVLKAIHNVHTTLHKLLSPRTAPGVTPFRQAIYKNLD